MAKVLGVGGVFFRSEDPKALAAWYAEWLGVPIDESWGGAAFPPDTVRPRAAELDTSGPGVAAPLTARRRLERESSGRRTRGGGADMGVGRSSGGGGSDGDPGRIRGVFN